MSLLGCVNWNVSKYWSSFIKGDVPRVRLILSIVRRFRGVHVRMGFMSIRMGFVRGLCCCRFRVILSISLTLRMVVYPVQLDAQHVWMATLVHHAQKLVIKSTVVNVKLFAVMELLYQVKVVMTTIHWIMMVVHQHVQLKITGHALEFQAYASTTDLPYVAMDKLKKVKHAMMATPLIMMAVHQNAKYNCLKRYMTTLL